MALDDTDRGILFLLPQGACGIPTRETAERAGASARTARNCIEPAENRAINGGDHRDLDYDEADDRTDAVGTASDHVACIADEIGDAGPYVVAGKRIGVTHPQPFDHSGQQPVEAA